jgi:uncharacterized protein YeaO (DUF488 family)
MEYNLAMLRKETIEWYRQMSPSERLRLTFLACRKQEENKCSPEFVAQFFEERRKEKDESNLAMLKKLYEAEARREEFGY